MTEFSFKELYDVVLKATYLIDINGKKIEPGEVIARFDKIKIANFNDIYKVVTAHGGYQDADRVFWETLKEVRLNFVQGIFSKEQFAIACNSKLIESKKDSKILISKREKIETDENGAFSLKETPIGKLYIYSTDGEKLISKEMEGQSKDFTFDTPYMDLIVDYQFEYNKSTSTMKIGQHLLNGFISLEGKTRVQDDITGQTHSALIFIPKMKVISDINIRLGEQATPMTGEISAIACPAGNRNNSYMMEMIYLPDDIDSDF